MTISLGRQVDLKTFGEAASVLHRATVKNSAGDDSSELDLTGVNGKKPGGKTMRHYITKYSIIS
jgi:hypothetical protein